MVTAAPMQLGALSLGRKSAVSRDSMRVYVHGTSNARNKVEWSNGGEGVGDWVAEELGFEGLGKVAIVALGVEGSRAVGGGFWEGGGGVSHDGGWASG